MAPQSRPIAGRERKSAGRMGQRTSLRENLERGISPGNKRLGMASRYPFPILADRQVRAAQQLAHPPHILLNEVKIRFIFIHYSLGSAEVVGATSVLRCDSGVQERGWCGRGGVQLRCNKILINSKVTVACLRVALWCCWHERTRCLVAYMTVGATCCCGMNALISELVSFTGKLEVG